MNTLLVRTGWAACSVLGLAVSTPVFGADLEYGVRLGGSYSDNLQRTADDEQSAGAAVAGVDLRGQRSSGRLRYDVFGDMQYWDYFESGVDSQEFGQLSAQFSYGIVPETFEWMLSGAFDQVREDLLRPAAPSNVENVVTLSTGPRWRLRFGDTFEGLVEGHYTTADYSERAFDSETLGGLLTLGRRLSERSFFGLGAAFDDVSYESDLGVSAPDFERREYFLRVDTEGVRTRFQADAGYAQVSGANISEGGPMARLRATRKLTPFVSAFVGYTREFPTSSGAAFTPERPSEGIADDPSVLTGAPRETQSMDVGLTLARPRTGASLIYGHHRELELVVPAEERTFDSLHASFTHYITPRSSVSLFGVYSREKLSVTGGDSNETFYGGQLNVPLGRKLGLDVRVEHRRRDSDTAIGSYSELSGGIFLRYGSVRRFGSAQVPTP